MTAAVQSLFLPETNCDIAYWFYPGSDNADQKDTLIFVHGFRGDHHGLELIIENLSEYNIIAVDLPGFGHSPPFKSFSHTAKNYAAVCAEFIDEYRKENPTVARVSLVGHSFGSIIVSYCVAMYPDVSHKLILINAIAVPALSGPHAVMSKVAHGYYKLARALPEKVGMGILTHQLMSDTMSSVMTKTSDKNIKKYIKDAHRQHFSTFADRDVVLEAFDSSISDTVADVAFKIKIPVLSIIGDQDDLCTVDSQQYLAKSFGHGQVEIIFGVGHLIHYETPRLAAAAIDRFIKE